MKKISKVSFLMRYIAFGLISLFFFENALKAEGFYINESFRGKSSNSLTFGGSPNKAFLTANADSLIDSEGDGWLRLTRDQKEQKGYAIINQSFASTNGVLIDMEFNIWRTNSDGFGGADGFSIFLYDATVTPFSMGGFGGSLGYAQRQIDYQSPLEHGLTGGYVGIGFDEYGNYSRISEARDGGIGFSNTKNTIGIRGPGSKADNWYKGYTWLTGNSSLGFDLQAGQVNSRPDGTSYYRRTQLEISPQPNGKYSITIRMMTQKNGTFSKVLGPYELPTVPPASLKMGLAASTGQSINIHEIRNLIITSAGGIRTSKSVDKLTAKVGDELTYTIDVYNQTDSLAKGLILKEALSQISSNFRVKSVTFDNHGDPKTTASNYPITDLSNISLDIAPISSATFTIKGNVIAYPSGGMLTNSATVDLGTSNIKDPDLVNNTSSASTKIDLTNAPDFVVSQTASQICLDSSIPNSNVLTLKVTNAGQTASVVGSIVTVKDTIPIGLQIVGTPIGSGWTISNVGNAYAFTRSDVLAKNSSYPNITMSVKQIGSTPNISFTNTAIVVCDSDYVKNNNSSLPITLYSPAVVNAGSDQTVYSTGIITLAGNNPGALTGLWTVVSGQASITNPSLPNTTVTLLPNSSAKLRWTLSNSGCSSFAEVNVSYYVPKVTLVKVVSNSQTFKLGSKIDYSFIVSNAGLVPLTDVVLTDNFLPATPAYVSGDLNSNNKLDVGENWIYIGSYTVKQADVDAGKIFNSATVRTKDPLGNIVSDISGSLADNDLPTSTPVEHINKVVLRKTVTSSSPYSLGKQVKYAFEVRNEGTTTLDSVFLIDNKLIKPIVYQGGDSIGGNRNFKLDVNETWRFTGTYDVTKDDIDFGKISNIATLYCRDKNKVEVTSISENNVPTVAFIDNGRITLVKTVNLSKHKPPFTLQHDTIDYVLTVKNIGNVPLDSITVTDLKYALFNLKQDTARLQPDSSRVYRASYKISQADVDAGKVINSALVTSSYGGKHASDLSGTTSVTDDPTITNILQVKSVVLQKKIDAVSGTAFKLGDKINYTLTAINTGTVTLKPPVITDNLVDGNMVTYYGGDDFNPNKFDPGERWTYKAIHTVSLLDLTNGKVTNVAYLSTLDPQGLVLKDTSDVVTTTIDAGPVARDDAAETIESVNVVISVLDNDGKGISNLDPASVDFLVDPNNPIHGTLFIKDGQINYKPESGFTGTITFTYTVKDNNGNISNRASVTVLVKVGFGLRIPNVFTPNGDGINDEFVITGLLADDKARLVVFNRWGGEFYSNNDYIKNRPLWNGYGLNDGTYFYILYITRNTKEYQYKGWVLIKR